jgi:small-conductance mechanosensitive channel
MTFDFSGLWVWSYREVLAGLAVSLAFAALGALAAHRFGVRVLRRLARRRPMLSAVVENARVPGLWLLESVALQMVLVSAPDTFPGIGTARHGLHLLVIFTAVWVTLRACMAVGRAVIELNPADIADNLGARRIQTQTQVLVRCMNVLIVLIGLAAALMTFPGVREIGASILASAGIMGLIAGFAARPVLGNLIAGLQIALTQPIRLDDVLIVLGEWGRVEEITGAYVVIRIWDERRLVVPLQWFVENPFQNWTRQSARLIGSVFIWVDYDTPIDPLREELKRLCEQAPEWDRRVCVLQVTDASDRAVQLRALVSSEDSGRSWDLRCKVREGLIDYVRKHHPESLPHLRAELHTESCATRTASDTLEPEK